MKRLKNFNLKFLAAAISCCLAGIIFFSSPDAMGEGAKKAARKKRSLESESTTNSAPKTAENVSTNDSPSSTNELAAAIKSAGKKSSRKKGAAKANDDKISATNEIQLSFQGANIDMIVQWLAQTTGKSVVKHPKVQCQLTIVGSKKVTPREALNLVYRALALEGFSVVESSKAILIVPEGQEPKTSPEMIGSEQTGVPEGRQRLVKVFKLKHIQAASVKEKIKTLLSEKATADVDERANQLIVTDYTDNIVVIGNLIRVLDTDNPEDITIRVIPLKNVNAVDLAKEVGPLYQKMGGGKEGKETAPKETVEITANDRSNSLIIYSSEATFKIIEALVARLDTEEAQEKIMRTFPLKNADAQDVAKQLQDLNQDQDSSPRYPFYYSFSSMGQNKAAKKMNVVADRRRNTVIVQAPPAAMENIAKMVEKLDEAANDDSLAPKIFPLKYVSAGDIEDILNELFLKKQPSRSYWNPFSGEPEPSNTDRDVGRLYGKVRVTSEPHANALIVTANSAENLAAVEDVLKQLDVPSEAGETTFRIGLKFAKAATVANSINILFAKGGSPGLRSVAPPGQPGSQSQQQNQNTSARTNFELEQEAKEEGYFPWLGGQPENLRGADGRNVLRTASDLVGRVRVVPDQRSNSLLVSANVHFFPQVLRLIEDLDAPTAQVLIEAKIVEVSTDYLDKLGVRWSPDGSKTFTADDFDNSLIASSRGRYQKGFGGKTSVNNPLSSSTVAAAVTSLRSGTLDNTISMEFLVQFLRRTTDATVLAEPQINISDNELGKLFVGQQVPTLTAQNNPALGGTSQSFEYKDVGIILEVTPHINNSGDVALKIRTESSAIVPGQTLFGAAVIDSRNFRTDVSAKSGQTLVLGGIIQKQISDTLRKTPILGDIPGLKWAFNKKDKLSRRVELMVFLRTTVVRTAEEAKELLEDVEKKIPLIKKSREIKPEDSR